MLLVELDNEDVDDTLDTLLDEVVDDCDEVTDELLTLPLPAALDDALVPVPPVQPHKTNVIASIPTHLTSTLYFAAFINF